MIDWDLVQAGGPEGDDDCTPEQGTDEGRSSPSLSDCARMGITNEHEGVEFRWRTNTKRVSCKYCKSTTVHWKKRADKWILFDNITMLSHFCNEYFAKKGLCSNGKT